MELVLGKITLACQDVEATLRLSFTISMNNFSQFTRLAVPIMALLFSGSFSKAAELLAYYNFDGQSADQSGNGTNATLNGVVIDGGSSAPTATISYGDEDGGKNEGP